MTHTIILTVGTSSTQIGQMAMRQVQSHGDSDRASAVFVFAEDPGFFGIDQMPGVRWHRLPKMREILRAVTDDPDAYPWLTSEAIGTIRTLASAPGDGLAGSPGAGRVAFTLVAAEVYNSLKSLYDDARTRGDDVEVLIVTCCVGGTSRGSLLEAGLLVQAACPDASVRRNVLVLPSFAAVAHDHEYSRRAANALSALQLVEEGMVLRLRTFTGPNGREAVESTLADEVLVVAPAYQADPHASVKSIDQIPDILTATARIVGGLAGGERAWKELMNRTMDSTAQRVEKVVKGRIRWVCAVNEARIVCGEERLLGGVRNNSICL